MLQKPRKLTAREIGVVTVAAPLAIKLAESMPPDGSAAGIVTSLTAGEFTGRATLFGVPFRLWQPDVWEMVDTIIEPGAFAEKLAERAASGRKPIPVYREHREAIGPTRELIEDETGLFVRGRISDTQCGRDTLTLMRDNVLGEMSIGILIHDYALEQRAAAEGDGVEPSWVWRLTKLELTEVTITDRARVMGAAIEMVASEAAAATERRHPLDTALAFARTNAARPLTAEQRSRAAELIGALSPLVIDPAEATEAARRATLERELLDVELTLAAQGPH